MVREFKLINEKGQEFSLMDINNNCLLTNPDGLGYSYSSSYEKVGDAFVEYLRQQDQVQIIGTCNFIKYDNYTKLVNFIESSKQLRLSYKIPYKDTTKTEYFKNIKLQSLGKTEIQPNGVLSCLINFDMTSLWYEEKEFIYDIGAEEDEIRWDFRWASRFMNYNLRKIDFNNIGHTEASFNLEIDGEVTNPEITVTDELGNILFNLRIPITINEYEKFIYNSVDGQIIIAKQNVDGTIESLFKNEFIDITNNNIYKLPQGITFITIEADSDIAHASLKIYPYYRAV